MRIRKAGFSLIELMIAFGLLMTLMLGIATVMNQLAKSKVQSGLVMTAQGIKQTVSALLANDSSWDASLANKKNKSFDCIRNVEDCFDYRKVDPKRTFSIVEPNGQLFFDSSNSASGFTVDGAACGSYPSESCPLRLELHWRAICGEAAPCILPQLEINGGVVYSRGPNASSQVGVPFNPEKYAFHFYRTTANAQLPLPSDTKASPTPTAEAVVGSTPVPVATPPTSPTSIESMEQMMPLMQQYTKTMCDAAGSSINDPAFLEGLRQNLKLMGFAGDAAELYLKGFQSNCQKKE